MREWDNLPKTTSGRDNLGGASADETICGAVAWRMGQSTNGHKRMGPSAGSK